VHSVTIWELVLELAFNELHLALLLAFELSSKNDAEKRQSDALKLKEFRSAKVSSLLSTLDSMLIWVF
jgi:hypothetical protein